MAQGLRPPSVERLISVARPQLGGTRDPDAVLREARAVVDDERTRLTSGATARTLDDLARELATRLDAFADPYANAPVPVLNGTGVIVHTNLGRAAWPRAAIEAATLAAATPSLLELDRATGRRGARSRIAEEHLIALTGAEDALVTNNNAAALALAVGLAGRKGVAVSRGELIEIGGGVRIPEIIRRAGARLIEVGTTNRTRAADYEPPLMDGRAAVVLRVHPSNFRQEGFVEAPDPAAVARLTHAYGGLVIDDLGSGALLDTADHGLAHEPTPSERLAAGSDLVTFSGDKLLGGPQAGLIAGSAALIAKLRRDPLARAMRVDKVTLAALAATLGLYRAGLAVVEIPVWRAIAADVATLHERAARIVAHVAAGRVPGGQGAELSILATRATVGGGSLPGETLPSVAVAIGVRSGAGLLTRLRTGDPAVVARIEDGRVLIDLRTIDPARDMDLSDALGRALGWGSAVVGERT